MDFALRGALVAVELALALPLAYLALLSIAALLPRRGASSAPAFMRGNSEDKHLPNIGILVPAHDEAAVIGQLLASIAALDYPAARYQAIVVADNCTDETASIARAAGALVYDRSDPDKRAKGYALQWLLQQLVEGSHRFDAYAIVDADSSLSPSFLRRMAFELDRGAQVIQARYLVRNPNESWASGLRAVAFTLFNHVRPLGRLRLGWSAGLKGNGMCFRSDVLDRLGWGAASKAEDVEFHTQLLQAGIRVTYAPETLVTAEMPTSLSQARSQQARWEGGRLALIRGCALPLLQSGLRRCDPARFDAAAEILIPPLSVIVLLLVLCTAVALLLGWSLALWFAGSLFAALALHLIAGVILARLSIRAYLSLLVAPIYILWKCWVYFAALLGRGGSGWTRTDRSQARSSQKI
ncbi:MAG TPA: glycosyltransferase family 2 protein [Ktedonobacterales bacterium]|nr:glycosyltransferase family 2 protein [Ktedonobacterales bacterium]